MNISEEFKNQVEALQNTNFTELARSADLGTEYHFKSEAETLQEIGTDLKTIFDYADIIRIPKKTENTIIDIARKAKENIDQINNFKVKDNPNATPDHDQISTSINNLYQENLDIIVPLIERAEILKLKPDEIASDFAEAMQSVKQIKNVSKEVEKSKTELDTSIKEIRDAFGSEGAGYAAKHFGDQAIEHQQIAHKWLIASIGAVVLVIIFAGLLFWLPAFSLKDANNDYARIAQVSLFKIIILSIGYFAVYQCVKSYKINRHLYVSNRHRQLALDVYKLMAEATNAPEQSGIILGQAVKAIFEPGTTGFLDGDTNPNPINLTEIVNKYMEPK